MIQEAKVIGPPGIVAGKIGIRLYGRGRRGDFTSSVATNDQGLPTQFEENLRGTVRHFVGHDIGA